MRKIPLIIFNYIYIIAILILTSILVTTLLTGTPSIFGLRPMFVMSESMEPVIEKYQFILAVTTNEEELKVGDIVGYQAPKSENALFSKLVVHRIVAINEDGTYFLQGDANLSSLDYEEHITAEQIKYKVIWY